MTDPKANWLARYEAWLDGDISEKESLILQQQLRDHAPELANQMNDILQLQAHANAHREQPVKPWNPAAIWHAQRRPDGRETLAWWQRPWLPISSMACSLLAVALVLGNVAVTIDDNSMQITFGDRLSQQQLDTYAATLRSEFKDDVTQANTQLVNYVLATSRSERREDFADLIRYVNEQREDDHVFYVQQLRQIEDELLISP